jgi:hypothetical protein
MAGWLLAFGVVAFGVSTLVARLQRRAQKRKNFTAGSVSDNWLADARAKNEREW